MGVRRDRFFLDDMAVDVVAPSHAVPAVSAVYLYGLPGTVGVNRVSRVLSERGWLVLHPHYPGTYDSGGRFTPEAALTTLAVVARAVGRSVASVRDGADIAIPPITLVVGHSFGCFVALRSIACVRTAAALVLLGPAIAFAPGPDGCGLRREMTDHYSFVLRSHPHTYRLAPRSAFDALYSGKLDALSADAPASLRSVVGIVGATDPAFDIALFADRFDPVVRKTLSGRFDCTLTVVEAGHDVDDLAMGLSLAIQ